MALPNPEDYGSWQEFAKVLVQSLSDGNDDATVVDYNANAQSPVLPEQMPEYPDGFRPIWLSTTEANLYMGNHSFDPPVAPDLFQVDTLNIALAAIETANLGDDAVSTAKIQNAAIHTAKIANAAIVSALIGDLQVVEAKIADLAVNSAKIANAAITSAKIANLAVGAANIQIGVITNAHIANATILTANIGDAQVTNAKIGDTIQSSGWDPVTKAGWKIDKTGRIEGRSLALYNDAGQLVFGSGALGWQNDAIQDVFGYATAAEFIQMWGSDGPGEVVIHPSLADPATPSGRFARIGNHAGNDQFVGVWKGDPMPYDPNSLYEIEFMVRQAIFTGSSVYLGVNGLAADKVTGVSNHYVCLNGAALGDTWVRIKGYIKGKTAFPGDPGPNTSPNAPARMSDAVQYIQPLFICNYPATFGAFDIGFVRLRRMDEFAFLGVNTGGFGQLAALSDLTLGGPYLQGFGNLAALHQILNSSYIADGAITGTDIASGTVQATNLINALFDAANIGTYITTAAIGGALIANAAIGTALIADAAVLTAKIGDAQVVTAKIADGSILTAKIGSAQITTALIADAAILTAKIGAAQITSALIADAAIVNAKIGNLEVDNAKIQNLTLGTGKLQDSTISNWATYMANPGTATTNGVWVAFGSFNLTTKTSGDSGVQVVSVVAQVQFIRNGSSMDTASIRMKRNGVQISGGAVVDVPAEKVSHCIIFFDASPPANTTCTYEIEIQGVTDTPAVDTVAMVGSLLIK